MDPSMKNKYLKPCTPVKTQHLQPVDPVKKVFKNSHNSYVMSPFPKAGIPGWRSYLITWANQLFLLKYYMTSVMPSDDPQVI